MKTRIIYARGFVDTKTGETFNACVSMKGWRLIVINLFIRLLTSSRPSWMRAGAYTCWMLAGFTLIFVGVNQ